VAFLSLPDSWRQSTCCEKSTAQRSFFRLRIHLMCLSFCCQMHSKQRHHSLMQDSPHLAVCHVSNKHKVCCCTSRLRWPICSRLSVHCYCHFYTAVWSDWFCSTCYVESLVAVIKSENRVGDLSGVATSCYKCHEFRVKQCVLNKTALKYAQNHAAWFERFQDASGQM